MESEDGRRPLPSTLVPSLNALLAVLSLPFTLETPTDLTPSLLLAILESIIEARLPIPNSVRASKTGDAKVRAMLVLLGVLECDLFRGGGDASELQDGEERGVVNVSVEGWATDIGLGEVDPIRLAGGGWEEVVFVGELLCWLARRRGILPPLIGSSLQRDFRCRSHIGDGHDLSEDPTTSLLLRPLPIYPEADNSTMSHITDVPRHPALHSPEASTSGTTATDLSLHVKSVSSRTSYNDSHVLEDASALSENTVHPYLYRDDRSDDHDPPPVFRPRCIHELEEPAFMLSLAGCSLSESPQRPQEPLYPNLRDCPGGRVESPTPVPRLVRLTGWIDEVDTQGELKQFVACRAQEGSRSGLGSRSLPSGQVSRDNPSSMESPLRTLIPSTMVPISKSRGIPVSPDDDDFHDPPFNVSFSTSLNTSTPVKPKVKVRPPKPLMLQTSHRTTSSQPCQSQRTSAHSDSPLQTGRRLSSRISPPSAGDVPSHHLRSRHISQSCAGMHEDDLSTLAVHHSHTSYPSHPNTRSRDCSGMHAAPAFAKPVTTVSLLNERARLLTELAALKRARTANGGVSVGE